MLTFELWAQTGFYSLLLILVITACLSKSARLWLVGGNLPTILQRFIIAVSSIASILSILLFILDFSGIGVPTFLNKFTSNLVWGLVQSASGFLLFLVFANELMDDTSQEGARGNESQGTILFALSVWLMLGFARVFFTSANLVEEALLLQNMVFPIQVIIFFLLIINLYTGKYCLKLMDKSAWDIDQDAVAAREFMIILVLFEPANTYFILITFLARWITKKFEVEYSLLDSLNIKPTSIANRFKSDPIVKYSFFSLIIPVAIFYTFDGMYYFDTSRDLMYALVLTIMSYIINTESERTRTHLAVCFLFVFISPLIYGLTSIKELFWPQDYFGLVWFGTIILTATMFTYGHVDKKLTTFYKTASMAELMDTNLVVHQRKLSLIPALCLLGLFPLINIATCAFLITVVPPLWKGGSDPRYAVRILSDRFERSEIVTLISQYPTMTDTHTWKDFESDDDDASPGSNAFAAASQPAVTTLAFSQAVGTSNLEQAAMVGSQIDSESVQQIGDSTTEAISESGESVGSKWKILS